MSFTRQGDFIDDFMDLPDKPNKTATEMKAMFQSQPAELKETLNQLMDDLESTVDAASGADQIGVTAISGWGGSTVQSILESARADYVRNPGFGSTAGSANAYTVSTTPALPALVDGASVYLGIHADNTGASTLNWDNSGAKAIVDSRGAALIAGMLKANTIVGVRYNASVENFQLLGEGGSILTGNATAGDVLSGKTFYKNDPAIKLTGTMPNRAGDNACLSSSASGTTLKLVAPGGAYDGVDDTVTITDADFVAGNIANGVNLFGLTGSMLAAPSHGSQAFTSSGTFTVPAGVTRIFILCIAGGGGGSASNRDTNYYGQGGSSGGYAIKIVDATPGSQLTVTVGAAGSAGVNITKAGNGGNSSVGGQVACTGGIGGTPRYWGGESSSYPPTGHGTAYGSSGTYGGLSYGHGPSPTYSGGALDTGLSFGGNSIAGEGGRNYGAASGYGAGGSAGTTLTGGWKPGTAGTAGLVYVWW